MKLLKLIVCLLMTSTFLVPWDLYAQEVNDEPIQQTDDFDSNEYEVVWNNPYYPTLSTPIVGRQARAIVVENSFNSMDEASLYLRGCLVNRSNIVSISFPTDETDGVSLVHGLMNNALLYTGISYEGDYILYNGLSYHCSYHFSHDENDQRYFHAKYTTSYFTTVQDEEIVTQKVQDILSSIILPGMSDYEKVAAIYDYVCSNISYDYTSPDTYEYKYTTYAALIDHSSVCQGYASSLYRLINEAGISCHIISSQYELNHSWNAVCIDGLYYYMDATRDAGNTSYQHFLLGINDFDYHTASDTQYQDPYYASLYPLAYNSYFIPSEGWYEHDGKLYYYHNGEYLQGWQEIDGDWYYFKKSAGYAYNGLKVVSNQHYYFDNYKRVSGLVKVDGALYYFNKDGIRQSGWKTLDGKRYYFSSTSGKAFNGMKKVNNKYYYFKSYVMQKSCFKTINGNKYYFNKYGQRVTGWKTINKNRYYFNSNGKALNGMQQINGKWYYFSSYKMKTGFVKTGGYTYYFNSSGVRVTGYQRINGKYYYFDYYGRMR